MFQASMNSLQIMLETIRNSAKQWGFKRINLQQIEIATEEILVNIINYAYPQNVGLIQIECQPQLNRGIQIRIIDWGISHNPLIDSFSRKKSENGGRGIALVLELMDEISYQRIQEQNILTLTKYS